MAFQIPLRKPLPISPIRKSNSHSARAPTFFFYAAFLKSPTGPTTRHTTTTTTTNTAPQSFQTHPACLANALPLALPLALRPRVPPRQPAPPTPLPARSKPVPPPPTPRRLPPKLPRPPVHRRARDSSGRWLALLRMSRLPPFSTSRPAAAERRPTAQTGPIMEMLTRGPSNLAESLSAPPSAMPSAAFLAVVGPPRSPTPRPPHPPSSNRATTTPTSSRTPTAPWPPRASPTAWTSTRATCPFADGTWISSRLARLPPASTKPALCFWVVDRRVCVCERVARGHGHGQHDDIGALQAWEAKSQLIAHRQTVAYACDQSSVLCDCSEIILPNTRRQQPYLAVRHNLAGCTALLVLVLVVFPRFEVQLLLFC